MKTIFVSSTFKDMHFERDAIQEITLPTLKSEAIKYGENVSFCDLRWGINTGDLDSEEGSRKVLDVCLDEIDRCKPPMVIILGDRYGWIPSEDLTKSAAERKKMELEDLQISVTALEIAYGALSTPERCRQALFYYRHIESECPSDYSVEDVEHERKLTDLKAKIAELTGNRVKHYSVKWDGEKLDGVIPFAEMLAEDIANVLRPEWKKKELLAPFERERLTHWTYIEEKNQMFSAREALVQKYYDNLTSNKQHFLAIKAPSGAGKSMLFSNLALKLRDDGYNVIPFMSGLTSESNDSVDILKNTIYYLEELLELSHEHIDLQLDQLRVDKTKSEPNEKKNAIEKLRERLYELCIECEHANKRVVIMVDAVDQLAPDDNRDNFIFIPSRLSVNVKFVMTCLLELQTPGKGFITLKPINESEKRAVIEGILKSHNRELEERVVRKMIKAKASNNPLFLSLLVQRLLMMNRDDFLAIKKAGDDMTAISKHQLYVISTCPDSLQKMSAVLLREAGKRINDEMIRRVAEYLAVSRHGLRQEDLAALVGDKWSALDFAHFITYMDESFIQRDDGRFDFSHKCIREGFLELCRNKIDIHSQIIDYLESLPMNDSVRMKEIVYHYIATDNKSQFVSYINEIKDSNVANELAAKDLFAHCMNDGGKWFCDALADGKQYGAAIEISQFVTCYFDKSISGSISEMRIRLSILNATVKFAESCHLKTVVEQAILLELYMVYAETSKDICQKSKWAFRDESELYYIKAYDMANGMVSMIDDYSHLIRMITICHHLCEHESAGWAKWKTKITYYANMALELCNRAQKIHNTEEIKIKTIQSYICLCEGHEVLSIGGIDAYKPFEKALQLLNEIDNEQVSIKETETDLKNIYLLLVKIHPLQAERVRYFYKAMEVSRKLSPVNKTYNDKLDWVDFNVLMGKLLHERCREDDEAKAQMDVALHLALDLYAENPSSNVLGNIVDIMFQKSFLEDLENSITTNIEALSFLFEKLSDTDEMLYVFPEILIVLDLNDVENRNILKFKLWIKYLLKFCKLIYRMKIKNEAVNMPHFNHQMIMGHLINEMQSFEKIENPQPIINMIQNRRKSSKKYYKKTGSRNNLQTTKNMLFALHSDYCAIGKLYFKSTRSGGLNKAIKYYTQAARCSKQLLAIEWGEDTGGQITSYSRRVSDLFFLGLLNQKLGKYKKGAHYFNQCIELSQNVPKFIDLQIKEYIINAYIGLGECQAQRKKKCEHILQKALDMRFGKSSLINMTKRDDSPDCGGYRLKSWEMKLPGIVDDTKNVAYKNKFLIYMDRYIDGRYYGGRFEYWGNEILASHLQTYESYANLLSGYRYLTRHYAESNDVKYKNISLDYALKALSISQNIVENWNTGRTQQSLIYDYLNVAYAYLGVGDFDKAQENAAILREKISFLKNNYAEINIDEAEALLCQLCGDVLLAQYGKDNSKVNKAIEYYIEMLALDEKNNEDGYNKYQTMAFSVKKIAEAHELLENGADGRKSMHYHQMAVQYFEQMLYIKDAMIPDNIVISYLIFYCISMSEKENILDSEKIFFVEKAIQYWELKKQFRVNNSLRVDVFQHELEIKLQKYKGED